ncbi:MAG: hypothetical protein RIR12_1122 [Bacteroidota bacterium]
MRYYLGMKKAIILLLLPFLFLNCKKTIQNTQQDLVVLAMTDGQWAVTNFTLNSTDITSDFSNYKFKYYSNKTVDAIKAGVVEKRGTWDGNAATMSTSANFITPPYPLDLINGHWQITRNSWTYVEASQNIGGVVKNMRLDKQ